MIREDWDSVQSAAEADDEDEAVVRSFGKMCAFSFSGCILLKGLVQTQSDQADGGSLGWARVGFESEGKPAQSVNVSTIFGVLGSWDDFQSLHPAAMVWWMPKMYNTII